MSCLRQLSSELNFVCFLTTEDCKTYGHLPTSCAGFLKASAHINQLKRFMIPGVAITVAATHICNIYNGIILRARYQYVTVVNEDVREIILYPSPKTHSWIKR